MSEWADKDPEQLLWEAVKKGPLLNDTELQ